MKTSVHIATVVSSLLLAAAPSALAHGRHHTHCAATRGRHHHVSRCHRASDPIAHTAVSTTRSGGGTTSGSISAPAQPAVHCNLFASPSGSDATGNGSIGSPYASFVKLDSALSPGQTGCLRAGTYGNVSTWQHLTNSGTGSGQITITVYPGETATVDGWIDVEAAYTTISHLEIDDSNNRYTTERSGTTCAYPVSQGLAIAANNDVLEFDDIYQSVASLRGNGVGIGWWGDADNTIVAFNKIHDTGQCDQFDHSIYLASGNNVRIYDNWIWNNHGGQSVSVYPGATNARVYSNVLDGSDSGFTIGDDGSSAVTGDEIYHNVVADSGTLSNPDRGFTMSGVLINCSFSSSSSTGNQVYTNDSYNNPGGVSNGCSNATNVSLTGSITSNPKFVNAAAHNYTVPSTSPAAGWGLWNGS